jgi:hypothetical protein
MELPFISNEYIMIKMGKRCDTESFIKYIKNPMEPLDCCISCSSFPRERTQEILEAILECDTISDNLSTRIESDSELMVLTKILQKHKIRRLHVIQTDQSMFGYSNVSRNVVMDFASSLKDIMYISGIWSNYRDLLIYGLVDSKSIESLHLSESYIRTGEIKALDNLLLNNKSLKSIDLSNVIKEDNLRYLKDSIIKNTTLEELRISYIDDNETSYSDCMEIISEIVSQNKSIRTLEMHGHHIDPNTKSTFIKSFKKNTCIKRLSMDDIYLESPSTLTNLLRENRNITDLNIGMMELKSDTKEIGAALRTNKVLDKLYINASDNIIDIIKGMTNVSDLTLYNTENIGDICKILEDHNCLRHLNIFKPLNGPPPYTDQTADIINRLFDKNRSLETCMIDMDIVDENIDIVVKILEENKQIKELTIRTDKMSDINIRKILRALKHNISMYHLYITGWKIIWNKMKDEIDELFKENITLVLLDNPCMNSHQVLHYLKRNQTFREKCHQLAPLIENGINNGMLDVNSIIYKYLSKKEGLNNKEIQETLKYM